MKTLHDKNIGLRLIELLCIETSLFEKRLYIIHIHITFDASVTDKEYVQCEEHIYIYITSATVSSVLWPLDDRSREPYSFSSIQNLRDILKTRV